MTTDMLLSWLAHAEADPAHLVARDDGREVDQAGMRREVEALAAGLLERGVIAGDRVALQLPNSVDFLVGALSCLWVGAVFVPLAVTDPPARVEAIVADCSPALVLTSSALTQRHPQAVELTEVARTGADASSPFDDPDAPAYMIYTSGTTGTPKGVVIGRRAFAAAAATIHHLDLDRETRTLCVSPFHFDGSFATLFPTVAAGGYLVIPPRESLLFARFFLRKVASEQITYTGFSSSYLRLLLANRGVASLADTPLGIIALGGEVCSGRDVTALWELAPAIRMFNRYGPTETTIAVTHFEVTREVLAEGGPVPIGVPHDGVTFHVVDGERGGEVAPGEVGELYIGGAQLMSGYWGAPELTASVLRSDVVDGETVYRTGDLVRVDDVGRYVYVDRADRVVKRNAVRISLVELGDVMRGLPGVNAAVCVAYDNDGRLGIAGFVVTTDAQDVVDLRRAAAGQLSESMLPDVIEIVAELPVASSSKVDERRLLSDAGLRPL